MSFSTHSTVHAPIPALPYKKIKDDVIGEAYALSLVFIGDKKSRTLNMQYRGKAYVPNVLSFPLTKSIGEICINPHQAKREAQKHGMTVHGFIGYLFIHGLLHLEGHRHGATMEEAETRLKKRYHLV